MAGIGYTNSPGKLLEVLAVMEKIYKLLGTKIRQVRSQLGLTQEKLAELTGLSVAFIGQIERGHNRASLSTIQKLADALNKKVSALFIDIPAKQQKGSKPLNRIQFLIERCSPSDRQKLFRLIQLFLDKNH